MVSTPVIAGKPMPLNGPKKTLSYLGEYIPPACLVNLKKYKYSSTNRSILSHYLMQSYWDFVASLVPLTVAPNMITFIGFWVGLSGALVVFYYYFLQNALYPAWVWYYLSASTFFYQTMDAIDGKQARRTGTSGPLGELFDHGCDALLLPFFQATIVLMTNLPGWMVFAYFLLSSLALFTSIWEQYSTGVLALDYFSAPTEGIILSCVLFLLTGRYSTALYDKTLVGPYELKISTLSAASSSHWTSLPFLKEPIAVQLGSFRSLSFVFYVITSLWTILTSIAHVINLPTIQSSKLTCFLVALPVVVITILHVLLYLYYPIVHDAFPLTFELSFALLISFLSTRLTLSRLCGAKYPYWNGFYVLTFLITGAFVLLHCFPLAGFSQQRVEQALGLSMLGLLFFGIVQYSHMFASVSRQIASYLNLNVLSFTPKKKVLAKSS